MDHKKINQGDHNDNEKDEGRDNGTGVLQEQHSIVKTQTEKQPSNMDHKENEINQDDHSDNENYEDWDLVENAEIEGVVGNKYFILLTGKTMNTETTIINHLKHQIPDLQEVTDVEKCDFILVICPVVSRAGTDIEAAVQKLRKISDTKHALLVVLHHTFDPECVVPDSSSAVKRASTSTINCLFHEDQGLLRCPKNDKSFATVPNHIQYPVPRQTWYILKRGAGIEALQTIFDYTASMCQIPISVIRYVLQVFQGEEKTQEPELRLVLLGRTGSGKSAAGNTILGREERNQAATSTATSTSTQQSESTQGEVAGRRVTVVDTLDWFSPGFSLEKLRQDVGHCVHLSAPGPHAFLLVIPVKQPTGEERGTLEKMEEMFGEGCWRNTMILFSVTDELQKKNIEKFIQSGDQELQMLVQKCGNRFHCLNIRESGDGLNIKEIGDGSQVSELLEKIQKMVEGNRVKFYSSKIYQETEIEIEKMIAQAKEKSRKESEMKENQSEANYTECLLQEFWKYTLTQKYKDARKRSADREDDVSDT